MKKMKWAILFTWLISVLVIAYPAGAQADFVIENADEIAFYTTSESENILTLISNVEERFIYQYVNQLYTYNFSDFPVELGTLIQNTEDRFIFQYVNLAKFYTFYISPEMMLIAQETNITPSDFSKLTPLNNAIDQSLNLILDWEDSTAPNYEYCFDIIDDEVCNTSWVPITNDSQAYISDLAYATVYYWQVQAVNSFGTTEADNGEWWSFTTESEPPGPFAKLKPKDGAINQKTRLTLEWELSVGATVYEYCISKTEGNCSNWISAGPETSVIVNKLKMGETYYWQVRGLSSSGGITEANDGDWWEFTTKPKPSPPH